MLVILCLNYLDIACKDSKKFIEGFVYRQKEILRIYLKEKILFLAN